MTLKEKVKETLSQQSKTTFTVKNLYDIFAVQGKTMADEIVKVMDSLCDDGEFVFEERTKKYKAVDGEKFFVGIIQGNSRGFGFCIDEKAVSQDLFISRAHLHGALHRDRVLVRKIENTKDEGEVVKILQRGMTQIVGRLDKKNQAFVIPDDSRFAKDIFIPQRKMLGAKNNQKVLVKITSYPNKEKNPEGEIVKVIGYQNEKGNDILSVAYQYGGDSDQYSRTAH